MRVLYAIQGTGNGHISRARDIIPLLQKHCDLDILISGTQADVRLEAPVDYRLKGISFIFGKMGGVDIWNTYIKTNFIRIQNEIRRVPVRQYNFVINDFEPISAWACYLKNVPCLALSHQAALLDKHVPKPKRRDAFGEFILKNYAPSMLKLGFHFQSYATHIRTPIIRQHIRDLPVDEQDHYTVYLPAYDHRKVIDRLKRFSDVRWQVFSKHARQPETVANVTVLPVNNTDFIKSIVTSKGVLSGAGFEVPAETLFLQKKLLVVPMKKQHEQHYNAAALKHMGVPILKNFKKKNLQIIDAWLTSDARVNVDYPNETERIIESIFAAEIQQKLKHTSWRKKFELYFSLNKADNREEFRIAADS